MVSIGQKDYIRELARKYDLDTSSGDSELESLKSIAEALGMENYDGLSNDDTDELEKRMKDYDNQQQELQQEQKETEEAASNNSTYQYYDDARNNYAAEMQRRADEAKALDDKIQRARDKFNNYAKKHGDTRLGKIAGGLGDGLNRFHNSVTAPRANKANEKNEKVQNANNLANAIEHPVDTLARKAAKEIDKKVDEVKDKAKEAVKSKIKKLIIAHLPAILTGLATAFVVIIIPVFFFVIVAGNGDDNQNATANNGECGFTLSATSLSRDEYINAIKKYSSSHSISSDFTNNAGAIYDKATSKHLNPELVVIRAIAESGANSTSAAYNYWGMGCTNTGGGTDCHSYSSFMAGVDEYLDNISQYKSLLDMMSKYSYLGDFWYNPGNAGTGGCYYANFIYDTVPTRVKTACAIGNECSGTNCVTTTVAEREQYTKWQVEKNMASIREKVFNLKYEEGVACSSENNGTFNPLTEYNLKHQGLQVLSRTLSNTEIATLSNYIYSEINAAGRGTGAGVAAAGQALVHGLEQKGYYLQYYWGGGHGDGDGNSSFTGVNKNWGSKNFGSCSHGHGPYLGMDCSGFVSWSIRTACNSSFGSRTTGDLDLGNHISIDEAKPGDLMLKAGSHVRLVIKNKGNGSIITAEESGSNGGLIFTNYNSTGGYNIIDMKNYYKDHCK